MKNKFFGFSLVLLFTFVGCGGGGSDSDVGSSMVQLRENVKFIQDPSSEIIKKEINQNNKNLIVSKKIANTLKKGDVFYVPADEDSRFPLGFSGRVENMTTLSDGDSKVELSDVGIFDIMEKSKQEKVEVKLNEENFIGVISPAFVKSSLTKQQKLLQKGSKSFLDGGVRFVSKKSSNIKEKSILGDEGSISFENLELNLKIDLKKIFPSATSTNPLENSAEAKLKVSGLISNLLLTEEHDWNINIFDKENNYFEISSIAEGKMNAEAKLYGNFETTFGLDNRTWREVEEDAFTKFGINLNIKGLESNDKQGMIPIIGLVYRIPNIKYPVVQNIYRNRTQTPVRSAKHGGVIFWIYMNFKGELSLDGELGIATNIKKFKIGIDKKRNKDYKLIQEVVAPVNNKLLEAPFFKGELKLSTTLGLSAALDVFYGGVRISNSSFNFMIKQQEALKSEKRVSYGTRSFDTPWKWSENSICSNSSRSGGFIFNTMANFELTGEAWSKDVDFNINWNTQYPLQKDIDKTDKGWVNHLWYVSSAKEECIGINSNLPIKGSIALPNTADQNYVFLSKDTQTAFVLTKSYSMEGNLYLYSYDISNPNAIQLLDTQLLEGGNYRYGYSGIYLSKDKTKLYTLIIDDRYGDNIFSITDISTPSSLNMLGRYKSYIDTSYFYYNLMRDVKGFSEDESKVYFLSYILKEASYDYELQKEVKLLDISDPSNMNLSDDDGLNYTLAGHEPQSSSNGVSVSVQDKKLIVERN